LGGLGRSGTTLLERVLGELPHVCAVGEVVHLWRRDLRDDERCGCGERFSACGFWRDVGEAAFGGWDRLDLDRVLTLQATVERTRHIPRLAVGDPISVVRAGRARGPADFRAMAAEYAGYYAAVYRAAAQVTGAAVVVDSSKHSALAHCLRWAGGAGAAGPRLDLRVVHVVRDPRAVAYSWTRTVARPETDGVEEMTRYSPTRSALLWDAHNAAFGLLARRGVPVRRLRYEDFVADPRRTVRELVAFAGLPVDADALRFLGDAHADLSHGHSAAGNPMRFTAGRVPVRADELWRSALPAGQRRLVAAISAPMLRRYGYRLRPADPAPAPSAPELLP
jgi:hypothetical protein